MEGRMEQIHKLYSFGIQGGIFFSDSNPYSLSPAPLIEY